MSCASLRPARCTAPLSFPLLFFFFFFRRLFLSFLDPPSPSPSEDEDEEEELLLLDEELSLPPCPP